MILTIYLIGCFIVLCFVIKNLLERKVIKLADFISAIICISLSWAILFYYCISIIMDNLDYVIWRKK